MCVILSGESPVYETGSLKEAGYQMIPPNWRTMMFCPVKTCRSGDRSSGRDADFDCRVMGWREWTPVAACSG